MATRTKDSSVAPNGLDELVAKLLDQLAAYGGVIPGCLS